MRVNQAVLLCVVTVVAVGAILGGQFVIYRHFEELRTASQSRYLGPAARVRLSDLPSPDVATTDARETSTNEDSAQDLESIQYFPFEPGMPAVSFDGDELEVVAEAAVDRFTGHDGPQLLAQSEPVADDLPLHTGTDDEPLLFAPPDVAAGAAPEPLAPGAASPIFEPDASQDELRKALIAEELPNASDLTRDIWSEELKGLPLDVVRDILRMRRSFDPPPAIGQVPLPAPQLPAPSTAHAPRHEPIRIPRRDLFASERRLFDDVAEGIPAMVTDIHAAQSVILNNIANLTTDGFKRSQVFFEDLHYDHWRAGGQGDAGRDATTGSISVGWGTRLSATHVDHAQGELRQTGNPLHLSIEGRGFFQVRDGVQLLYTRCGRLCLDAEGKLVLAQADWSRQLEPPITLPPDAADIRVSAEGAVTFAIPQDERRHPAGAIMLIGFMNSDAVEQRGECLFAETAGSGPAFLLEPGVNGCGQLRQGFLEQSNVDLDAELAELTRLRELSQALRAAVRLIEPAEIDGPSHPAADLDVAINPDGVPALAPQLATEAAETATDSAQQ